MIVILALISQYPLLLPREPTLQPPQLQEPQHQISHKLKRTVVQLRKLAIQSPCSASDLVIVSTMSTANFRSGDQACVLS